MESSEEIVDTENSNQLLQADKDILMSILPSNIWVYTFHKLGKKHPSSLQNLSNSTHFFRNLMLSKRVLFLFPQVFKLIGPEFANHKNTKVEGSTIIKCRITCKSWSKAVDQFIINGTPEPDFFNTEPKKPSDHALVNARYQYFGNETPTKLPNFLSHFEPTHLPHSSRNPYIGKVVYIDLTGFIDQTQWASIADQVSTLLRKYGHHIKILNLGLFKYNPDPDIQLQNHAWLLEWLENCPNLTHLKVSERFNMTGEMDAAFGNCPNPERTMIRRCCLEMIDPQLARRLQQATTYLDGIRQQLDDFNRLDDTQRQNPEVIQQFYQAIEQDLNARYNVAAPAQQPAISQFPTFKNLICLKLCQLSALNFNALISANSQVVWLQVEPLGEDKHRYIDYHSLKLPNLKKLYIKLCSPEEVRKLTGVHSSWLSLTHLHFEYCTSKLCCFSPAFTEWVEIFGVIDQNWGSTLTDLKLQLPIPEMEYEKEMVVRDSGNCRLNLLNLKRLKIWLSDRSGEGIVKTDFLDLMRERLEQLIIE